MSRARKKWSEEELEYLSNRWGTASIPAIAKHLGRTATAVKVKADKLKLGAFLESGNYITVNQLFRTIGITGGDGYKKISWIEKRGLPVRTKKVRNNSFRVITIEDFWKWAYHNQEIIDFSKIEPHILGTEPEWVANARNNDLMKNKLITKTPWTVTDDNLLCDLLKTYKYTASELALRLRRSEGAVIRRISELNIKYRPLRCNPHTPWHEDEINELFNLIDTGFSYEYIGFRIPRHSTKAIRGLVYRKYGTENLDAVRKKRQSTKMEVDERND